MTATRIGVATLAVVWALAAAVLWRTEVPPDLRVEPAVAPFAHLDLGRHERHDFALRLLALASLAAQLGALALFAWRPPRVRGRPLVRAAQLGALAAVVLLLARLPFGLAALWWQRRYGIAQLGYAGWLVDRIAELAVRAALLAFAAAFCVWLARRLGTRWWLAAAPVFALGGVAVVLSQPLVTPRLESAPAEVVAQVARLAERQGLDRPDVEVRRTSERTRQVSAEAIGIGPTTRVVLWETTLALPEAERAFLVAHELAHVARRHLWKGLAWFVLLLVPGLAVLARAAPLRDVGGVPRALLVAFVLVVLSTPVANAVSRRYEAEADWVALETTRDRGAATRLLARIAGAGVRDPRPPAAWTSIFGTHPSLAERAGMADASERATRGAGPPRAGS